MTSPDREQLLILDRDGVINEDSVEYVKSLDEWVPIRGSIEAIARLSRAGYTIAVATNQSGLARGLFDEETLLAMHHRLFELVAEHGGTLDAIFYCPHGPEEGCDCRKPGIGLLRQIEESVALPLKDAAFVGDSLADLEAALAAGCRPTLVRTGKGEQTLATLRESRPDLLQSTDIYSSLEEFTRVLLGEHPGEIH